MTLLSIAIFSWVFVLGTIIGSFINVLVMRSLRGEQYFWGRSKCDACQRVLKWYELIPLFSFIALRGKCKTCHEPIDVMHPVVELLSGSLFLWWFGIGFAFFQLSLQPLHIVQPFFWLVVGLVLLVILITDSVAYFIPDLTVLFLVIWTILYRMILVGFGTYNPQSFAWALFGACCVLLFFALLWAITRGQGMGFGDVKLVFALALLLEWPNVFVGIFLGFIYGAVVGSILLVFQKTKLGRPIPFAPFLIAGTATALIWGDSLLRWYMHML